jgi:hypothetical protein
MSTDSKRIMSKAFQRKLDAALFKAIRNNEAAGVAKSLAEGANPFSVSRGLKPMERAMKSFPDFWSPAIVGRLMDATGTLPAEMSGFSMKLFVEGLTRAGQADALSLLMANTQEHEREYILKTMRDYLCMPRFDIDEVQEVAAVAFASAGDAEAKAEPSSVSWLHQIVCGGEAKKVGIRLSGFFEDHGWLSRIAAFRHANLLVLRHALSLRPRLDGRWLGMTPLHLAAFIGDEGATEVLLEAGADPDLLDHCGGAIGPGYGHITDGQLALIESHRLRKALPAAESPRRVRL